MNMNNDDFFNDIHDDVASDFRDQVCLPQEPNNKNKMILAVIASAVAGLVILLIVLLMLNADKKDDEMIDIGGGSDDFKTGVSNNQNNNYPYDMNNRTGAYDTMSGNNYGNAPVDSNPYLQSAVVDKIQRERELAMRAEPAPVEKPVVKPKVVSKPVVKKVSKPVVVSKPKVEEKKVVAKPVGPWKVQLLSAEDKNSNPDAVKAKLTEQWDKLVVANPFLKDYSYDIEKTSLKGKDWYRLRIVGLNNSTAANKICDQLKQNRVDCILVK